VIETAPRDAAPRWARAWVGTILAVFLITGFFGVEAWPFTGWRLFSGVRSSRDPSWIVQVVAPDGRETPLPLGDIPIGDRGVAQTLPRWSRFSSGRQQAICEAWTRDARTAGLAVQDLRLYRYDHDLARPLQPATQTLLFDCTRGSA
jgi:hypothetical protein